ncbi:MAG: hypothetical protein HQL56_03200 [Magnetococcales bacterium]|nr:hypothetical protein [Magnetococcales bacterium]MBF0308525.1 hypothetical protein [Magnetococcales bacterium]
MNKGASGTERRKGKSLREMLFEAAGMLGGYAMASYERVQEFKDAQDGPKKARRRPDTRWRKESLRHFD